MKLPPSRSHGRSRVKGILRESYRAISSSRISRDHTRKCHSAIRARKKGREERASLIARSAPLRSVETRRTHRGGVHSGVGREGKDDIIPLSQFAKQIYAWDGPGAGIYDNV